MTSKGSSTLADRSPGGVNIINQTNQRTFQMLISANSKCTRQIFPAGNPAETGLGYRIPGPDQPIGTNQLGFLRKKQAGKDCCLIQPPPAMSSDMERNRDYPVAVGKFRQITAHDYFRNSMSD
jgi:hypothetical protein